MRIRACTTTRKRDPFCNARRQHPKSIAVLGALGSLEIEAESYDPAIEALRSAVVLAPDDVKLRNLLGSAYLSKGDSAAALEQFEKVLVRDPANHLAHYSRAQPSWTPVTQITNTPSLKHPRQKRPRKGTNTEGAESQRALKRKEGWN